MALISFKKFIQAIHTAILSSNEQVIKQNQSLLRDYFEEAEVEIRDEQGQVTFKKTLTPKTVTLTYPEKNEVPNKDNQDNFSLVMAPVEVPLIALVPMTTCGIEKATFTTEFQMQIIENDLHILFGKAPSNILKKTPGINFGKLEITLSPHETPEGLKLLTESYENFLKRQIT
jgi:hypothetical protein